MADALQIFDSMGANLDAASALNALADIELRAGNTQLALRHATCALAWFSDFDDLSASMDCREDMARLFITLAQYGEAEKYARETLEFARERQEDVYVAFALHHLGAIAALRGLAAGERTDVVCEPRGSWASATLASKRWVRASAHRPARLRPRDVCRPRCDRR